MDLKSMLNDAAGQRPTSLHSSHSSFDARISEKPRDSDSHTRSQSHSQSQLQPQSHPQTGRPLHYPPALQPVDLRVQSTGGYFNVQTPHPKHSSSAPIHNSPPSAGPQAMYARSPGGQSQPYTPRESVGPPAVYNPAFVQSPLLSVNQPPTTGAAYQHHNHTPSSAHSQSATPIQYAQAQSPRGSKPINGQPRHMSPITPHAYPQPATPLGPPLNYNRVSPHVQRPTSQGGEQHFRKASYGSAGSAPGRDNNSGIPQPAESGQRQSNPDLERVVKERERSVSVSPKTIPQPSPYRQMSVSSQAGSQGRPSIQSLPETRNMSSIDDTQMAGNSSNSEMRSDYQQSSTPRTSTAPGDPHHPLSRGPSVKRDTPDMLNSPLAPSNLKRNASVLSEHSQISQMQPRKRLKREEVPIFARSARSKPLRLNQGKPKPRLQRQNHNQPPVAQQSRSQATPPPTVPAKSTPPAVTNGKPPTPSEFKWESSIANITPFEDLTRRVCDWIYAQIGLAEPPLGGAMFEIEAKIGEIFDVENGRRIDIAVDTEAIFSKERYRGRTKFESSMNMEQHMLLNKYLNELTREAFVQAQKGERSEILYDHPHEVDEFFELTPEGRQNLNPSILQYLNARHKPRVRRTRDRNTGQPKAQIIKSRIADLEIYNPGTDFDCRISISIESPWEGNSDWLIPMSDGFEGRSKDRMSYRHMAYQIDLTQVSHEGQTHMEHELEIEISTEQIRQELDNLKNRRPSRYEELVKGLIDNVRLLCRKGSLGRRS